jgi:hypothetical protein
VGPRAVLDAVVKRKIPRPHRESNPRIPIVQPVAQRYNIQFGHCFKILIGVLNKFNQELAPFVLLVTSCKRLNVKLSLCLTKHHAMKTYRGR